MGNVARFWSRCFWAATKDNTSFANDWQWLIGAPAVGVVLAIIVGITDTTELKPTGNFVADAFIFAFLVFFLTWIARFMSRLYTVPATFYQQLEEDVARFREQLRPKATLRFNPVGTECVHSPQSNQTWVRVVVESLLPVPLPGAVALLERIEYRKREEDPFEPQLHLSPVHLSWSGASEITGEKYGSTTIYPRIRKPIDVFYGINDGDSAQWRVCTESWNPGWCNRHGQYRLIIHVSIQDTVGDKIALVFNWNGHHDAMNPRQDAVA